MSAAESSAKSILEEHETHDTPLDEPMEPQESHATQAAQASIGNQPFSCSHTKNHNNNNNRHVVPVGVLVVLCTLYLTSAALQRSCSSDAYKQNAVQAKLHASSDSAAEPTSNVFGGLNPLDRLLEHADVCHDLEIFTKEIKWPMDSGDALDRKTGKGYRLATRKKLAPQKPITAKSASNGHSNKQHNNKSAKIKYNNNNNQNKNDAIKKEKEQTKKNSTAEPIIYLFALVFIYLLLKAASDINQHYKAKSKGDKRLRRCSLQSYAQTHKQDRRASKDKRQRLLESRCKSVDRHTPTISEESVFKQPDDMLAKLRQTTAVDQQGTGIDIGFVQHLKPSVSKPEEITKMSLPSLSSSPMASRRCSVPNNSLNYRRPASLVSVAATTGIAAIPNSVGASARRTSIAGGSITASGLGMVGIGAGSSFDGGDPLFPEVKRRVRMINRH